MGMVTGKYQDYDTDFVFATVQTLSKEDTLSRYKKEHWDLRWRRLLLIIWEILL